MDKQYSDLLNTTKDYAEEYIKYIPDKPVFPTHKDLQMLQDLKQPLPKHGTDAEAVIKLLHTCGLHGTTAQTGGRYFGFVNGGLLPVAHAAAWLIDTWNQNSALYAMSPAVSVLEQMCESWIVDLLGLKNGTAMGLVTGSANAMICALAAARNELLKRQGYNLAQKGLRGAPPVQVVMGAGAHSTVTSALSVLGIGSDEITRVPTDAYGRIIADCVPPLDCHTLFILQAGNVNGGGYDPIDELCDRANAAGAWVHIDGAFGLWAAASCQYRHLVKGLEKADSYSLDAHKTLNAGYDCGIVLCRDREALTGALAASGSYIPYSENRDGMRYTTEMSRRARAVALWAVLKNLGADGVQELVNNLCGNAEYFADRLKSAGFCVVNPVFFNQFMVKCDTNEQTKKLLQNIQNSGVCWCGGSEYAGDFVIRVSVCSHATTREDIEKSVAAFCRARGDIV